MEDNKVFSWDNDDWFNTSSESMDDFMEPTAEVVDTIETPETTEEATVTPVKDVDEPVEESTEVIKEEPTEETEEVESVSTEEEETEGLEATDAYKELIKGLRSQGFLDGEGDTIDDILEQHEEKFLSTVEQQVNSVFEELKTSLGEEGTELLGFLRDGGTVQEYVKLHTTGNLEAFDMSSDSGREQFLRYQYGKIEGQTPEEVEDRIEFLINTDRLEATANRLYGRQQEKRKEEKDRKLQERTHAEMERKRIEKERAQALKQGILSVKEVAEFRFSPSEKRDILNYVTNPTEKMNGRMVPPFVAEINRYQTEAPEKLALLVKLMKSDFDFSEIKKQQESKVARKIKKAVQAETDPKLKQKQQPKEDAPVWDLFQS